MNKYPYQQLKEIAIQRASGDIKLAGNKKLKIYGLLSCASGKRMKSENRIFFQSVTEAVNLGYRPCARCLLRDYQNWKNGLV
ncbi:Ada metal-binding domain-containing protein [Pedobacter sp. KR3-3]|uniref:Ada metal-binding domain-containing protein n=1 Tax=Pedobacter albus TaxID=3113905 RepID=A0ABU7I3K2_9SPHI|nr:Ada metal-binding domain-containing protein [Pedobacter sp. KR3-3]MEE1944035.1 Ada metal-binding domain-containing protein [Pedobacter sp. KR3-3]